MKKILALIIPVLFFTFYIGVNANHIYAEPKISNEKALQGNENLGGNNNPSETGSPEKPGDTAKPNSDNPDTNSNSGGSNAVCKIGDVEYEKLSDALNAAKENEETVITLLKNIDIKESMDQSKLLVIGANKNIVITDNNSDVVIKVDDELLKTYRPLQPGQYAKVFYVAENGTLTFNAPNTTIVGTDVGGINSIIMNQGTLNFVNGTIDAKLLKGHESAAVNMRGDYDSGNKAIFNMSGGTIKNVVLLPADDLAGNTAGSVIVGQNSEFNMSGGEIKNGTLTNLSGFANTSGVLLIKPDVRFKDTTGKDTVMNLSGGKISNNIGFAGGGVTIYSPEDFINKAKVVLNMSGGEISSNSALFSGGGVAVTGDAIFNMTGGEISNNFVGVSTGVFDDKNFLNGGRPLPIKTLKDNFVNFVNWGWAQGGGVSVGLPFKNITLPDPNTYQGLQKEQVEKLGTFTFKGGKISNNTADLTGGGIYVNSNNVNLYAGEISGNKSYFHGGGIYVSSVPKVLHLQDAVITNNKAMPLSTINGIPTILSNDKKTTAMGGGLWLCPTGTINVRLENGVAIFGNKAEAGENELAAGDDIVTVLGQTKSTISIPDRALGGGLATYYNDGGIKSGKVGEADGAARYNPEDPGEPLHFDGEKKNVAAITIISPNAQKVAQTYARLLITNNTSSHGGGIGTNGDITLIGMDVNLPSEPNWTLNVNKKWNEAIDDSKKEPVKVFLTINGTVLDSIELNSSNNWSGSFKSIPESVKDKVSVVEGKLNESGDFVKPLLWDYEVSQPTFNQADKTIAIDITNNQRPLINIPVVVKWLDADDKDVSDLLGNTKVGYEILKKVEGEDNAALVNLNENQELDNPMWAYTWNNLLEYSRDLANDASSDNEQYKKFLYTVKEINSDGTPINAKPAFFGVVDSTNAESASNAKYILGDKTFSVSYSYDSVNKTLLIINKLETEEKGVQTDPPATTDGSSQTDPHPTTDGSSQTDPHPTTDGSSQTDPHPTTDGSSQTDPHPTTDGSSQTDPHPTTDGSSQTDPHPTTDGSSQTDPHPTNDGSTQTEPSNPTNDGSTQTEPSNPTNDGSSQTEPSNPTNDGSTQTEPEKPSKDEGNKPSNPIVNNNPQKPSKVEEPKKEVVEKPEQKEVQKETPKAETTKVEKEKKSTPKTGDTSQSDLLFALAGLMAPISALLGRNRKKN